ncbi:MAG TPA: hypothetical protein VK989_08555 [Polyangia bacterium]|nr:hypothetical protein [Polyangia bacterium]
MSKRFLIPVFAFTVAAISCGGGPSDTARGDAGAAVGDASTAGADAAMTGLNSPVAGPDVVCSLATFCPVYIMYCGTATPGYTTPAECMATFAALGAANPTKQMCQSTHLCLAIYDTGSDRMLHCLHASGGGDQCGF